MANITAKDVAQLREMTNCGMMDCKRALVEADGDFDSAVKILREKGLAKAAKKAGRIAAEGLVKAKTVGNVGVVVEINSETDFCAKSDKFQELVEIITDTIIEANPADVEALSAVTAKGTTMTIGELLTEKIATIGENIKIRRFTRMEGALVAYMHDGGRIGTMVKLDTDSADNADVLQCGKDCALQITALNAQFVSRDEVPAETLQNEREVQMSLVQQEGKPANVAEKIVEGRIRKYFEEVCLLDQAFFKDDSMTVGKYVESVAKNAGVKLSVSAFVRYEKGEGLAKKEENFADEVASMIK